MSGGDDDWLAKLVRVVPYSDDVRGSTPKRTAQLAEQIAARNMEIMEPVVIKYALFVVIR